jgi:hypothetical protein
LKGSDDSLQAAAHSITAFEDAQINMKNFIKINITGATLSATKVSAIVGYVCNVTILHEVAGHVANMTTC